MNEKRKLVFWRAIMTKPKQRVLGIRLGAATVGLCFSILLSPPAACWAQAQNYSVLYSFPGKPTGSFPTALIRDSAGNLYGTTQWDGKLAWGTVFKVSPTGAETTLYTFMGMADGGNPEAGLVMDSAGNLYGTTYQGGEVLACGQVAAGCGVVFKLDTAGKETPLYTFTGGTDGANPSAGLITDASGNFYGTTVYGGDYNNGTVFKIDTTGKETVLHSFTGTTDGGNPKAGLVLDQVGNLYGTAQVGGTYLKGTAFKLGADGEETVLHSFSGSPDGAYPVAGLVMDTAGNFYGTTFQGGTASGCYSAGCGVVFKLDSSNNETVLYSFTGGTDGANPESPVVLDSSGNLYSTTLQGGTASACFSAGCGVVFRLATTGAETVLHSFGSVPNDGSNPAAGLIFDVLGNLYGSTQYGVSPGTARYGTVFTIASPGFLLSASALTPGTVNPGGTSSSSLSTIATGGFTGSITLSCSVQPLFREAAPGCSIAPNSVAAGKTATLTVTTTGTPAGTMAATAGAGSMFAVWIGLIGLALAGPYFGPKQGSARHKVAPMIAGLLVVFALTFVVACGGGSGSSAGTPSGTYTVTVTGTSQSPGIAPQTTQLTLTVQ
jgi:uncharacterized repeat protein (TIGR03803 family)